MYIMTKEFVLIDSYNSKDTSMLLQLQNAHHSSIIHDQI